MAPFHTAFSLGRVSRDQFHAQLAHGARELGLWPHLGKLFRQRGFARADVDAVAVRIERGRQAVQQHIAVEDIVGTRGVLGRIETGQRRTGGVVDHDHQHRPGAAPLEPVVFGTVDLHQIAPARTALPRCTMGCPAPLRLPQALLHQPAPQRLGFHPEVVIGRQMFTRQQGPEPQVILLVQRHGTLALGQRSCTVRRLSATAMHESGIALFLKAPPESLDLAIRELEHLGRHDELQDTLLNPCHDRHAASFPCVHFDSLHRVCPPFCGQRLWGHSKRVTRGHFQSGATARTGLTGAN